MKKRLDILFGVGLILFALLALGAYTTPYFAMELIFARWVQSLNLSPLAPILGYVDHIGFYPKVQIWVAILTVLLILLKKRLEALVFLLLAAIDAWLFFTLSDLIGRARPTSDLLKVAWVIDAGSFPSGHALMYTLLFGFLAYIAWRQVKPGVIRTVLVLFCFSIILMTGLARLISGQHWPTDILGSYLLGFITLYPIISLYEKIKVKKFRGLERFF